MSTHVKTKKQRWPMIVLIILLVVALLLAGLFLWQRQNIMALLASRNGTSEELAAQAEQTQKDLTQQLKDDYGVSLRELTDEEQQKIANGELSTEEIAALLLDNGSTDPSKPADAASSGTATPSAGTDGGTTQPSTGNQTAAPAETAESIISDGAAQMYALKASFSSNLSAMVAAAKSEYDALPADQRTSSAQKSIAASKLSEALAMEGACDAQVSSILDSVKSRLQAIGADTSAVQVLRNGYENEKASQKAYYLSLMG